VFRSPSGTISTDAKTLTLPKYQQWSNNHTYSIGSVDVAANGIQYYIEPVVTVTGGGGTGANIRAVVDFTTNSISRFDVVSGGSGYITTPTITITGTGVDARAYPQLENTTVRKIASTMKFDRHNYDINVLQWTANTAYQEGSLVSHNGSAWTATAYVDPSQTFDYVKFETYPVASLTNALDRVISAYQPTTTEPDIIKKVISATVIENATANVQIRLEPNDILKGLEVGMQLSGNTAVGGKITGFTGNLKTGILMTISTPQTLSANTVVEFTKFDLTNLISGLEYGGTFVTGLEYQFGNTTTLIDSIIQSSYGDSLLGVRPEDIIVDGNAYVGRESSYAPEELVPGATFDTLDMKVFTNANAYFGTDEIGYRVFVDINGDNHYYRIAEANTTVLSANLSYGDSNVYVVDASVLPEPGNKYGLLGAVFINGELITYQGIDYNNNVLTEIRRGVGGTIYNTLHLADSRVVDSSLNQQVPGFLGDKTWLTLVSGNISDGTGIEGSGTVQAEFLRQSPSYIP
jgi:hypothetical protein